MANFLLATGEKELADKVFRTGKSHPFVSQTKGVYGGLLRKVLFDLTDEAYTGRFFGILGNNWIEDIKNVYPTNSIEAIIAFCTEVETGRFVYSSGCSGLPAIIAIAPETVPVCVNGIREMQPNSRGLQHAIVWVSYKTFIDNGYEMSYDPNKLNFRGVLEINKSH